MKKKAHYAISHSCNHAVCGRTIGKLSNVLRLEDFMQDPTRYHQDTFDLARGMTWEEIRDDWGKRICVRCLKIFYDDIPLRTGL
jgi:hypothetical protein